MKNSNNNEAILLHIMENWHILSLVLYNTGHFLSSHEKLSEVLKDKKITYGINLLCYGVGSFGEPMMNRLQDPDKLSE